MDYNAALTYLRSTAWQGSRLGLNRVRELLERMGNPQRQVKFIHVAGTNGKGSTAAMMANILQQAGYRTGLYTSPYLYRFNERMQVNGVMISDEELIAQTEALSPMVEQMAEKPTEFELITCLAFAWFAHAACDIVVLEVGLGGRLDATNVIDHAEVAILTAIGLDHTEILGDTLPKIAAEKAGIVKEGDAVVLAGQGQAIEDTVGSICHERHAGLHIADPLEIILEERSVAGQRFTWKSLKSLFLPLLGEHQLRNAAAVLTAVECLQKKGWNISEEHIRTGLREVKWPARFERLHASPTFIVDGGHNPQCAQTVARTLEQFYPGKSVIFLLGVLADKDVLGVLEPALPLAKAFVTVTPDSPRALDAEKLAETIRHRWQAGEVIPCATVGAGVARAQALATPEDVICAYGSLYMAGEIRAQFHCYD